MKNKILTACIDEMNEKGLHWTMADLAARLSVSKRTLYEAFPSKNSLIASVIGATIADIEKQDKDILNNKSYSTIEKIKELMSYLPKTSLVLDKHLFLSVKQCYPEEWKKFLWFRENKLTAIEKLITQGIAERQFREVDMNIVKAIIRSTLDSFFEKNFLLNTDMTFKQAINKLMDILFYGLLIR